MANKTFEQVIIEAKESYGIYVTQGNKLPIWNVFWFCVLVTITLIVCTFQDIGNSLTCFAKYGFLSIYYREILFELRFRFNADFLDFVHETATQFLM